MRKTIAIPDELYVKLKARKDKTGKTLKVIIIEVVAAGLKVTK